MRCGTLVAGMVAGMVAVATLSAGVPPAPGPSGALAQVLEPARDAHARRREEAGGDGGRFGSFLTYLSAGELLVGVDNVRASDSAPMSDVILVSDLTFEVETDWRNHALALRTGLLDARYLHSESENFTDYHAELEGALDVLRGTRAAANASFSREHEERLSPDDADGIAPTPIERIGARAELEQRFGRLDLSFVASYLDLDFDDVEAVDGGRVNNDDRDRTRIGGSLRLAYPLSGRLSPFVSIAYDVTDYVAGRDDQGFDRDSDALEGALGAAVELSATSGGELALGYRRQSFDDPRLGVVSGLTALATFDAALGRLTSARLTAERTLRETTVGGAAGFFTTGIDFELRHDLLRTLEVNLGLALARNDFRGAARRDEDIYAAAGVIYEVNRYVDFQFQYDFASRDSDAGEEFSRNRVIAGVDVHY